MKKKRSKTTATSVEVDDPGGPNAGYGPKVGTATRKPDPNAPKITRPCTKCGKRFWSWKALFGHMRCHPERQWRGTNPPPNLPSSTLRLLGGPDTEAFHHAGAVGVARNTAEDWCANPTKSQKFPCSSCEEVLRSHQAMGGHHASHKNVKGFLGSYTTDAATTTQEDGGGELCCLDLNRRAAPTEDKDSALLDLRLCL
ncbi:hypothetical protein MLD38_013617 [Melastoma candidum]|uniref:Uncharacterized protein n=1 Tax=Melastoma candidum TaxID=119954 RepID=A0ACB9RC00_9MYRT|nr:hypothetical protein MLD38_013617 [Melastoma candidum]